MKEALHAATPLPDGYLQMWCHTISDGDRSYKLRMEECRTRVARVRPVLGCQVAHWIDADSFFNFMRTLHSGGS